MIPLQVTARLSTPIIGADRPLMLDAPLSWAYAMRAIRDGQRLPLLTPAYAADFPLPLDKWERGGEWGWKTSAAVVDVVQHVTVNIRRKPATDAMARYSTAAKHHAGLGPMKARDATLAAELAPRMTWYVVGDRDGLADLLELVTNLGARHRNDFGHVDTWTVEPHHDPDAWQARPMPHPDGRPFAVRAPYWHPTRRVPCL